MLGSLHGRVRSVPGLLSRGIDPRGYRCSYCARIRGRSIANRRRSSRCAIAQPRNHSAVAVLAEDTMTLGDVVVERTLEVVDSSGAKRELVVRIGKPVPDPAPGGD